MRLSRSIVAIASVALLLSSGASAAEKKALARVKEAVFLVKPHYHDQTRALFKDLSQRFSEKSHHLTGDERAAYEKLAAMYGSHADSPSHGSGWLVRDEDGSAWVVTNKHVAGEAEYVTLEWAVPTYRPIERCRVVYVDPRQDLAVIAVDPQFLPESVLGFQLMTSSLTEGDEVAAVGFPGVPGFKGVYQYTEGIVNNAEFPMGDGVIAIQHSATIDPGNSGGPLIVADASVPMGFRVVGVNTWGLRQRTNVNLSIRAAEAKDALERARAAARVLADPARLSSALNKSANRLAEEMGSGTPVARELYDMISYAAVAKYGPALFPTIFAELPRLGEDDRRAFLQDPVEYMRTTMFGVIVANYRQGIGAMELKRVFQDDLDRYTDRGLVRTQYEVAGRKEEIGWVFEHGTWRIASASFERMKETLNKESVAETKATKTTSTEGTGGAGLTPEPKRRPPYGAVWDPDENEFLERGLAIQMMYGAGSRYAEGSLMEGFDEMDADGDAFLILLDYPLSPFFGIQAGGGYAWKGADFSFSTTENWYGVYEDAGFVSVPLMARVELPINFFGLLLRPYGRAGLALDVLSGRGGTYTVGGVEYDLGDDASGWYDGRNPVNLSWMAGGGFELGLRFNPSLIIGFDVLYDQHLLGEWKASKFDGENYSYRNWYYGMHLTVEFLRPAKLK